MCTIKRILVPIDFSDTSARVLEFGRLLADACCASLHLLHIVGHPLTDHEALAERREAALSRLDSLLDRTDREMRRATTSCEVGTPANAIVAFAGQHAIDLIVMGTHWHGPTASMATGSIAEAVLGLAPCALLAVKAPNVVGPFQRVIPCEYGSLAPSATRRGRMKGYDHGRHSTDSVPDRLL
jgi:nucleotide-binding universal stress UspA family protein